MQNNQKIPEGWNIVFLNSLSSKGIMNGIFNNPTKVGKGVPLINVVDLYNDKIDIDRLSLLDVSEDELKRYEAITGDLLFTRSSLKLEGIAQCNIVPTKNSRCVFDCHIMRIRPNDQLVVPYYLFAYCNTAIAKIQFMKLSKTTTMTTIDQDGLGQLKVLLPPLAEQEKIAGILGTWDEAIEKLSSLIEQKKLLKKGLTQRLLTGKTRLNGFTQHWQKIRLGKIGTTYTGLSGKNKDDFGKGAYFIPYMNIYQNNKIDPKQLELVDISDNENQNTVQYGDIFFTTSSETPEEVGFASVLLFKPEQKIYLNSFCFGYRLNDFDTLLPNYASFLFRSNQIRKTMYKLAQGATRFNLSKNELMKEELYIPSDISEQQAIADVLLTADDEINLLNQKLEALKEQKKGLMQQLLTGQIRVKVN